jgi:hypothetical protein
MRLHDDDAVKLLSLIYDSMSPGRKALTGTVYALRLTFSRLCSRLDIYGISASGGGTYFDEAALTKKKHSSELDCWLLHHIMKNFVELQMCIHI